MKLIWILLHKFMNAAESWFVANAQNLQICRRNQLPYCIRRSKEQALTSIWISKSLDQGQVHAGRMLILIPGRLFNMVLLIQCIIKVKVELRVTDFLSASGKWTSTEIHSCFSWVKKCWKLLFLISLRKVWPIFSPCSKNAKSEFSPIPSCHF